MWVFGVVFDIGIELCCGEDFVDYIIFQFGYVDVICGEVVYCFVKCCWNVVDVEYEGGYYCCVVVYFGVVVVIGLVCYDQEVGGVVLVVFDFGGKFVQFIDFVCKGGSKGGQCFVVMVCDFYG